MSTALVPLDGSQVSAGILECAGPLLDEPGLALELLGVVPGSGALAQVEDEVDRCAAGLEAVAARLRERGRTVRTLVLQGDPAGRILERARQPGVELVVMATHGRSGIDRWVRGSVAERVLRSAPVPLFLANPRALVAGRLPVRRILVPLDGSPEADQVLPLAVRSARAFGATVVLLRVEPFVPRETAPLGQGWDPGRALARLEPQERRLRAEGVLVERVAAYGVEAAEIVRASEDADLVILSTHGRSGPSRWWFGSVAEQVLRHCTRPLLVERARPAQSAAKVQESAA